jgi:hypothetical protein
MKGCANTARHATCKACAVKASAKYRLTIRRKLARLEQLEPTK